MKITKLSKKRLLLEFPTKKEMNLTNFRITEFTEGLKKIRGKYFTPDEFIDANSDKEGNIKYFSYWEGHNYTKKAVLNFKKNFLDLSKREKSVITACKKIDSDGYVISMVKGDTTTLRHEMAHGIYFENLNYKKEVNKVLSTIPKTLISKWNKDYYAMGYGDINETDELHAYLVAFDKEEWKECFPSISAKKLLVPRKLLSKLFDLHNK